MKREDIIRMALEAELIYDEQCSSPWVENTNLTPFLERFAELVASAERERLTDAAMKSAEKAVDVAIALEREACAKVCETFDQREAFNDEDMAVADACATAIRARGQA